MKRKDILSVDECYIAYLRAAQQSGLTWQEVGVSYASYKQHRAQYVLRGEAKITVPTIRNIIDKLGEIPPLPAEAMAILERHVLPGETLPPPGNRFGKNKGFPQLYDEELRLIRLERDERVKKTGEAAEQPLAEAEHSTSAASSGARPPIRSPRVPELALYELPATGLFVGRQQKLATLDEALQSAAVNAVVLVGVGGCGKTAIANAWLDRNKPCFGNRCDMAFGWTFSKSGTSPDMFIQRPCLLWRP